MRGEGTLCPVDEPAGEGIENFLCFSYSTEIADIELEPEVDRGPWHYSAAS
ncbi:MAG: hypothetical protein HY282_08670 [Nitrospirae bacterium]|nr:hypothetical protein [Candidatus Manganitrophaceae bacterium]